MKASFVDRNQYKLAPVVFLSPALILFSIYVVYPILSSLWIRLYEWDGLGEKTWVGIRNYIEMWEDDRLWLPLMLQEKKFIGTFIFDQDDMIQPFALKQFDFFYLHSLNNI